MNFPTSLPHAEQSPRDDARPNSEPASRRVIRRSPLAPIGGWLWLRGKQRKDDCRPATKTARSPSPVLRRDAERHLPAPKRMPNTTSRSGNAMVCMAPLGGEASAQAVR